MGYTVRLKMRRNLCDYGHISYTFSNTKLQTMNKSWHFLMITYNNQANSSRCSACHSRASDALEVWEKESIPNLIKKHVIKKLKVSSKKYTKLKTKRRTSKSDQKC